MSINHKLVAEISEYDPLASFFTDKTTELGLIIDARGSPIKGTGSIWLPGKLIILKLLPTGTSLAGSNVTLADLAKVKTRTIIAAERFFFNLTDHPEFQLTSGKFPDLCWTEKIALIFAFTEQGNFTSPFRDDIEAAAICILYILNETIFNFRAGKNDRVSEAIVLMGALVSTIEKINVRRNVLSNQATKAAMARHKEDHAMKAEALAYYWDNKQSFKNMTIAAEVISTTIVPVKFRTVYDWIRKGEKDRPK